jgi:hypothetical protein
MKKTILLAAVAMMMASCTTTVHVTSLKKLNEEVGVVNADIEKEGYKLTGTRSSTGKTSVVGQSLGIANMGTSPVTQNTYKFTDGSGKTMQYSLSYSNESIDSSFYIGSIEVCECETSDPNDYERLCAKTERINRVPRDKTINLYDGKTTLTAVLVGTGIAVLIAIGFLVAPLVH